MRKFYFLLLLCCTSLVSFGQVTTTFWATGGAHATGYTDGTTINYGNMQVGNTDQLRGYGIFDLSSIPAGSTIMAVSAGIDVINYLPAGITDPGDFVRGNTLDVSLFGSAISMYGAISGPTVMYNDLFGAGTLPDPSFPSPGVSAVGTIAGLIPAYGSGLTTGKISLGYLAPSTTATYTITGLSGTTSDILAAGHAPYLMITYCPPPTAVTATGPAGAVCAGTTLSLNGDATGATDYLWAGPNSFTSTDQNPSFTASATATGIYTLTATNTCGSSSASATYTTTATVNVEGGPIGGITNVWTGFYDTLTNATPGGVWTSSNTAISTVFANGVDSGVSPGIVTITYTTPGGCTYTTSIQVIQSIFSQIPTIVGGSGGLGFPLTAWYPFCGDTTDKSRLLGSGPNPLINSGTGITPAVPVTDRFGIADDAYAFNGVSNVLYTPTFFPVTAPTLDYTYSCWFETDTVQNSIILYNGNPNLDGFGFVINDGASPTPGAGSSVAVLFGGVGQFLSTPISLSRWHNLVLKKNGNSYNLYIDHVSIGFFISPYNPMTSVFALGGDYSSTLTNGTVGKPFKGRIDDVAIYNRQLSNNERDSLYNFNPDARPFTLGNDTTICSDSITLIPNPQSIGNYYYWIQDLDTLGHDSTLTINPPAGVLGTAVRLAVGKPFGCFAYDTVAVYKAPIPIDIGASNISICLGDTITLTDVVPHSSSTTFAWSTGDTSASIRVSNGGSYSVSVDSIYHYTAHTAAGVPYADSSLCVGRDTVHVHVYAVPLIGLPSTYANCQGKFDTIRPYYDSAYTYAWGHIGFAPFSTDSAIIDSVIGTQVYWVRVTDTGCIRYDTISALIVYDTLTFFAKDTAICQGQAWVPSATYLLATDNHIAVYQWTPTSGIPISNVPNPTITPDTSAEYHLTVSYSGCPDLVDSFFIDVQPVPTVFPGNNRPVCQYDTIHLTALVQPTWYTNYSYTWSPSNALDASTTSTVVFHPLDTTSIVNMIVTVSTPAGCSAKDSVLLFVHRGNFLGDTQLIWTVCPGDSIQLTPDSIVAGNSVASYNWSPGVYLSDSTAAAPWVKAITTTSYHVIAHSQFGCRDTLFYQVNVSAAAILYFGADSVTISPGQSYLISPQTNCVNFHWYPPVDIDNVYTSTPTVTPHVNTTYTVYASTEDGCKLTDSLKIKVSSTSLIDIPNAFSPGSGANSTFSIIPKGAVSLKYFRIFNRWGNMVFETHDIDKGWDGNYNGKPQPFDTYVYEIEAEAPGGEVFQRVGNVTLLR